VCCEAVESLPQNLEKFRKSPRTRRPENSKKTKKSDDDDIALETTQTAAPTRGEMKIMVAIER